MKKFILGILVFGFILGIGQIWAGTQEQKKDSEFKLISPKELAKELRNPNSERLKAWGYLVELNTTMSSLKGLVPDEIIMLKVALELQSEIEKDPELAVKIDFEKILFNQNFEFDQFEKAFDKARKALAKLFAIIQKNLDSSNEEHQKASKKITEVFKKIENPDSLINQKLPDYRIDYIRCLHAFQFIQLWAAKKPMVLDEKLIGEIAAVRRVIDDNLKNETIKKDTREFKEWFSGWFDKLKKKLDELIRAIKTLPGK